jgi:hypothetical protein
MWNEITGVMNLERVESEMKEGWSGDKNNERDLDI